MMLQQLLSFKLLLMLSQYSGTQYATAQTNSSGIHNNAHTGKLLYVIIATVGGRQARSW